MNRSIAVADSSNARGTDRFVAGTAEGAGVDAGVGIAERAVVDHPLHQQHRLHRPLLGLGRGGFHDVALGAGLADHGLVVCLFQMALELALRSGPSFAEKTDDGELGDEVVGKAVRLEHVQRRVVDRTRPVDHSPLVDAVFAEGVAAGDGASGIDERILANRTQQLSVHLLILLGEPIQRRLHCLEMRLLGLRIRLLRIWIVMMRDVFMDGRVVVVDGEG